MRLADEADENEEDSHESLRVVQVDESPVPARANADAPVKLRHHHVLPIVIGAAFAISSAVAPDIQ